jgi:hypothetical protein
VKVMTWTLIPKNWTIWTRHESALIFILLLAGAATYLAIMLARPTPLADTALGDRWQCSKTAGLITICTKKPTQALARAADASVGYVAAR